MDDSGRYRVLAAPTDGPLRLLDRETMEPVVTAPDGHDAGVTDLRPGYLVDATLDWTTEQPTVDAVSVHRPTLYAFADEIDPVFEAAEETWADAQAAGDGMNSRIVRNTDNEVTGVVYVFAESGAGAGTTGGTAAGDGVFEEFRDGSRPLEPLVDRVNDQEGAAPREVFVLRPLDPAFVVVAIALEKAGLLADTMRDTYDCSRPDEPLA
jgi:hypothetical protein